LNQCWRPAGFLRVLKDVEAHAARHYASRPPRGSAAYEVASLKPDPADELLRWAEEPIAETGKPHPVLELREAVRQQRLVGDITSPLPVKRGPPPVTV